jgi:hypothetical protein
MNKEDWFAAKLFAGFFFLAGVTMFLVYHTNKNAACAEFCYPAISTFIQGQCHCATEEGWDRLQSDGESAIPSD